MEENVQITVDKFGPMWSMTRAPGGGVVHHAPPPGVDDALEWLAVRGVGEDVELDEQVCRIVLRSRALRAAYLLDSASGWRRPHGPFDRGHDVIADEAAPAPYDEAPLAAKEIPEVHVEIAAALTAWLSLGSTWHLIAGALGLDPSNKVLRAKVDKLTRRGVLDGCTCGCRGDFVPDGLCELGTLPGWEIDGIPDEMLPGWAQ